MQCKPATKYYIYFGNFLFLFYKSGKSVSEFSSLLYGLDTSIDVYGIPSFGPFSKCQSNDCQMKMDQFNPKSDGFLIFVCVCGGGKFCPHILKRKSNESALKFVVSIK